ncbi:hypothetical protein V8E54_005031 [Elaphomyces granulatus]
MDSYASASNHSSSSPEAPLSDTGNITFHSDCLSILPNNTPWPYWLVASVAPDTISPDWLQAPSDSRNINDANYAGLSPEEFDQNWNWDRELANFNHFANEIPSVGQIIDVTRTVPQSHTAAVAVTTDSAGSIPNGRTTCTYKDCFKTFSRPADFRRHLKKHNPNRLHWSALWLQNLSEG